MFLIIACSSSYILNSNSPTYDTSVQEFNEIAEGKEAEIILSDSTVITATDLYLSADSLYWFNPETKLKTGVAKSEISKVMFIDMWLGGLEGAGFGLVGGGGLGALVGQIIVGNDGEWGTGAGAAVGLILGGGTGLIVGSITGLIIGHTNEYEFQNNQKQKNSDK